MQERTRADEKQKTACRKDNKDEKQKTACRKGKKMEMRSRRQYVERTEHIMRSRNNLQKELSR